MAVLVVSRFQGEPDQVAAAIQEHMDPVMDRIAPELGARWHSLALTPDGVLIVDVWESAEAIEAAAQNTEVQAAIQATGLGQPSLEVYELVDHRSL